jgi:hypothetical protein
VAESSIVIQYDAVSLGEWFLTFKRNTLPSINESEFTYSFETLRTHYQCHSVIPKKYRMLKKFLLLVVANRLHLTRTKNLSRL